MNDYIDDESTDAAVISKLTQLADANLAAQVIKTDDGRTFAIHRNDIMVTDKTLPNAAEVLPPKVIALTTQLQTSLALCQYLHRFKDADSIMFADVTGSKITAILDYHVRPTANITDRPTPQQAGAEGKPAFPRHSAHRAVLQLRHSQEWAVWTGQNEKLMSHVNFANFLEENAMDVINPDGAALLELIRDLNVKSGSTFKSQVRQGDVVKFEYQKADDVSSKEEIEMPVGFTLSIPVYFGEEPITMNVLLRRKIDDGQLFLGFKIQRLENNKQTEFLRIAEEISAHTNVESVLGNPAS
jgi:hypothetical protein